MAKKRSTAPTQFTQQSTAASSAPPSPLKNQGWDPVAAWISATPESRILKCFAAFHARHHEHRVIKLSSLRGAACVKMVMKCIGCRVSCLAKDERYFRNAYLGFLYDCLHGPRSLALTSDSIKKLNLIAAQTGRQKDCILPTRFAMARSEPDTRAFVQGVTALANGCSALQFSGFHQ